MNEGVGDDTDLSAPLLDENDDDDEGGGGGDDIGIDYSRGDRIMGGSAAADSEAAASAATTTMGGGGGEGVVGGGGGIVTLHGESVDLRHMFLMTGGAAAMPVGGGGGAGREEREGEEEEEEEEEEEYHDIVASGGGTRRASSLSMGSLATTTTTAATRRPSTLTKSARRAIAFLSGAGRSSLRAARRLVAAPPPSSSSSTGKQRRTISQKSSLFGSPSTSPLARIAIPILVFANHALFFKAQTLPMWNLSYEVDVTISASADAMKSKAAADVLNLPHQYTYARKENTLIETFTYMDAIRKLWRGDGLGDARAMSKVAAALLVVASGVWPHLKLLLLHVCWFLPFVHGLTLGGDDGEADEEGGGGDGIRHSRSLMSRRITGISASSSSSSSSGGGGGGGGGSRRCGLCCSDGRSSKRGSSRTLRSPFLRTLSTLGKWSLADVLVVCILIAVLHLDWDVHPDEIRSGIEDQLPTLLDYARGKFPDAVEDCTSLLNYKCKVGEALVIHYPACFACQTLITNAYSHPEWTAGEGRDILEGVTLGGGGYARLRVSGMSGTYCFCAAVMSSILLSLIVDVFDERDRARVGEELSDRKRELLELIHEGGGGRTGNELRLGEEPNASTTPPPPPGRPRSSRGGGSTSSRDHPPSSPRTYLSATSSLAGEPYARLAPGDGGGDDAGRSIRRPSYVTPSPTTNCHLLQRALLFLLAVSSLPLVLYAVTLPTMQRLVYGGGPTLLHEVLGMIWKKEYSLASLVRTTGDAGGWDTFLMLTFGLFAIVGPALRSICLLMHVLLGLPEALLGDCIERPRRRTTLRLALYRGTSSFRRALLPVIDALGAFCCWEVLIVALFMIQWEIPSITDTIYQDDRCREADPEHGRTCIEVQFNAMDGFLTVGVAWFVLIVGSGLVMALAGDAHGKAHPLDQDEKRYEFGQPIPRRRANLSRDASWYGYMGATSQPPGAAGNRDDEGGEYFSPLQQQEEDSVGDNGLEQIVFL